MYDSSTPVPGPRPMPAPTLGLRIAVLERRFRFAELVSRLSGWSLDRAWQIFHPLPPPAGALSSPVATRPGSLE